MNISRYGVSLTLLIGFILTASGCGRAEVKFFPTLTPTVTLTFTPSTTPLPPTIAVLRIVVTVTPRPTDTPPPTPTLPFDAQSSLGRWRIGYAYQVLGHPEMLESQYRGTMDLEVTGDGKITGQIAFATSGSQPPCRVTVTDAQPITATVRGELRQREDGKVVAALQIEPDAPTLAVQFQLICTEGQIETVPFNLLWPALQATDELTQEIELVLGVTRRAVFDLSGTGGGLVYGTLKVERYISR